MRLGLAVSATLLVSVLVLGAAQQIVSADAPSAVGNLVRIDGTTKPGVALTKLVTVATGYVAIHGLIDGAYRLYLPTGDSFYSGTSTSQILVLSNVDIQTGTYRLKNFLGIEITNFEIVAFSGSWTGLGSSQLYRVTEGDVSCPQAGILLDCFGPYTIGGLAFNANNVPACRKIQNAQADVTETISVGDFFKVVFKLKVVPEAINQGTSALFADNIGEHFHELPIEPVLPAETMFAYTSADNGATYWQESFVIARNDQYGTPPTNGPGTLSDFGDCSQLLTAGQNADTKPEFTFNESF